MWIPEKVKTEKRLGQIGHKKGNNIVKPVTKNHKLQTQKHYRTTYSGTISYFQRRSQAVKTVFVVCLGIVMYSKDNEKRFFMNKPLVWLKNSFASSVLALNTCRVLFNTSLSVSFCFRVCDFVQPVLFGHCSPIGALIVNHLKSINQTNSHKLWKVWHLWRSSVEILQRVNHCKMGSEGLCESKVLSLFFTFVICY